MNLTQDQMQQALAALRTQGGTAMNVGGVNYMPLLNDYARTEGYAPGSDLSQYIDGFRTYDYLPTTHKSQYNGQRWTEYDKGGNQTGEGVWTGLKDSNIGGELAMFAALAAGAGYLSAGLGGINPVLAAEGGGGFGGTSVMGAAGTGGASTGGGQAAAFNAAKDSQLANLAIEAGGGDALSAYTSAAIPSVTVNGAAGGAGVMETLASGAKTLGGSGLLGPAATLIGGLLGSQPQEKSATTTRDLPEYLKPYVTGNNGLLAQAAQKYQASQSPENQALTQAVRNQAMGLLSRPIASNPRG